ncbi:maltose acetyltransferase domain-containing protein [Bifidobacterium bifidum]|uniref:maltose acetyltransferase domain-containing protein n=1 Tax=Bifidobacterium bifidum TaxID=1681 RepID=UPI003CFC4AA3
MRERAGDLCTRFNALPRADHAGRAAILDELLPHHGEGLDVMGPYPSITDVIRRSATACS